MKTILCILALTLLGVCLTAQSDTRQESDPFTKLQKVAVSQLEAKALASPVAVVETANIPVVVAVVQSAPIASGGDAKSFIYEHESGNNPTATNSGGCRGLGQACPGSKLPCGDSDYICQDVWFTNYMTQTYGTWENAKAHWLARVPVNGQDVGNWW